MLNPNKEPQAVTEQFLLDLVMILPTLSPERILNTINSGQECKKRAPKFWRVEDEMALNLYKNELSKRLGLPEGASVTYIEMKTLNSLDQGRNQNFMEN